MCGIAGLLRWQGDAADRGSLEAVTRTMIATLVHRGPDDEGVWTSDEGSVALAQRRLSIIDLSPLGHNPMPWDHGRLWITFNGEIYNFRELRLELEAKGHRFRSQTDTEVILAAYDQWGVDAVDRLVGMFAFALWDEPKRRLWIVRDRVGKKPLYYADSNGVLRFASELKAIVADPTFEREVDPDAIRLYLRYGYIPSPSTIYRDARKLPPGHFLIAENGRTTVTRYWDPVEHARQIQPRTDAAADTEIESRLETAVRQRMIADVPLGAFLSGGIDSSLVVALMQEQSRVPIRTFTIRFDNPEYNEADHAAAVARYLGTEHHEHTCDEREMLSVIDRLPSMYDEPFADSSAVPTYLVSRTARELVTVALSGDGGDELFFGYPRYRFHGVAATVLSMPRSLRRTAAFAAAQVPNRRIRRIADVLRSDDEDRYARFVSWWSPADVATMTGADPGVPSLYADALRRSAGLARDERPGLLDLVSYLPEDILTKVDRASMAVSLEVRAPLLDHRVVEFALGLPASLKRRGRTMKWILRQLLYKRVPQALVDRPKMGFGVPLGDWFRGPLRERMDAYCSATDLEDLGIDPALARALWAEFKAGQTHRTDLLWQMFMLVAWAREFRPVQAALVS
ncbi:MAG TPA: asparagine synthase (glutamine-hydrolyzing) [Vicinamibacterales bacterium]|nr:asparagine synthase (glutamine-hydrolyzing) [Vicinamibacterales bacterium]